MRSIIPCAKLTETVPARENLERGLVLVFSPIDGGYYFECLSNGNRRVSETFEARDEALEEGFQGWLETESEFQVDSDSEPHLPVRAPEIRYDLTMDQWRLMVA